MSLLLALTVLLSAPPCRAASVRTQTAPSVPSVTLPAASMTAGSLGSGLNPGAALNGPGTVAPAIASPSLLPQVLPVAARIAAAPTAIAAARPEASRGGLPAARSQAGIAGKKPELVPALFDGSRAPFVSGAVSAEPDIIPEWPGKTGDVVRLNGNTYVLGRKLGEGTSAWVYKVVGRPLVVKLIYPDLKDIPVFGGERDALAEMAKTPIAFARLHDASADGMTLVKDLVQGEEMWKVVEKGPLSPTQTESLLDLAAQLVSIGRTADLNWGNLLWDGKRWVMIDAGGFQKVGPWGPLGQILSEERRARSGIDAGAFLRALRSRLGPGSDAWRAVQTGAAWPYQKAILAELGP